MSLTVRRIRREEGETLRTHRLAALLDTPSAFGSTYDAEVGRTLDEWTERAQWGADGRDRVTYFAVIDCEIVGLVPAATSCVCGSSYEPFGTPNDAAAARLASRESDTRGFDGADGSCVRGCADRCRRGLFQLVVESGRTNDNAFDGGAEIVIVDNECRGAIEHGVALPPGHGGGPVCEFARLDRGE